MQDRKESAQKYLQGSRGIGYVEQNMVPQEKTKSISAPNLSEILHTINRTVPAIRHRVWDDGSNPMQVQEPGPRSQAVKIGRASPHECSYLCQEEGGHLIKDCPWPEEGSTGGKFYFVDKNGECQLLILHLTNLSVVVSMMNSKFFVLFRLLG